MSRAPKYIRECYKPVELAIALHALQQCELSETEARRLTLALHQLGYRIIKTGPQS